MKIKKGELVFVNHSRKGRFYAKAIRDFDTDKEEFYPLAYDETQTKKGLSVFNEWNKGDEIPCRNSLCKIEVINEEGGVEHDL